MNDKPVQVRFQCCVQTMPFEKMLDMAGFLICPEHHYRRYGWRSPRLGKGTRPDFGKSLLEHDQTFVRNLFGE